MAAITHDISICRLPRNSITRSTSRLTSPRTYSSRAESHAAAGSSIAGADRVGPRNDKSSKLRDLRVELRVAKRKDYWAISHMHCGVFYPEAKFPGDALLRMDRFLALALGRQLQERRAGNFRCIVAIAPERKKASEDPLLFRAFADLTAPLSSPFLASPFLGAEGRVVGAVVLDSLAAHVPQQRIFGTQTFRPRREIAYLSNLAVDESARGRGLGRSLAIEAERLAAKWGCRSVALHVDPSNGPAVSLYQGLGYRNAAAQPEWDTYLLERRQLMLMVKRLPPSVRDPVELSQPEHEWLDCLG